MRICGKCGASEPEKRFYDSRPGECAECVSAYNREYHARNREAILVRQAAYRAEHPELVRASQAKWVGRRSDYNRHYKLKATYGLTVEAYTALFERQDGRCAVCSDQLRHGRVQVDHDHGCCPGKDSCGQCVRGLLCGPCNRGLSHFRDDKTRLQGAIDYLSRWRGSDPV